jgi:hypothetical protein
MENMLQYIADKIIDKLEKTNTQDIFDFYFELGLWLDRFSMYYFKINLK